MNLLIDPVRPIFFRYLAAASGSAMVASVFGLIDAMMVGQYHGPAGNAALAVFNPVWSIIFSLGLLAGIGSSVLFANCRGKGDEPQAQAYFTLSVLYGIVLSMLAMVGIGLFQVPMFRFFGADDALLELVQNYLRPIWFAIPCCVFNQILSACLRNDNNPGLATTAVVIGGVCNAIGDYVCVFVLDLGIFGAGLATAAGQYITIAVMLTHFLGKKNTLRLVKPTRTLRKLCEISVTGFSSCITDLALGIIGILFNRQIMRYLGADALAVYGIITQVAAFAQCMAYGTGQAAQPIISQNYGAGQYSRIRECQRHGLLTCAVFGAFWTVVMELLPIPLVMMFMDPTPSVLAIAPGIIRVYGLSFLLMPFNLFAAYYFQSVMLPHISLVASLARSVVVSGAAILLLPRIAGGDAVWYAMLITEIVVTGYSLYYMVRCTKSGS